MTRKPKPKLVFIAGQQGEGKTTLLKKILRYLNGKGLKAGGILSEGTWKNNARDHIVSVNLSNGNNILFGQRTAIAHWKKIGSFYINPSYMDFASEALKESDCDLFVVDEVGRFELEENAWYHPLKKLLKETGKPMIWVVRESFTELIQEKFSVKPEKILHVSACQNQPAEKLLSPSLLRLLDKNK